MIITREDIRELCFLDLTLHECLYAQQIIENDITWEAMLHNMIYYLHKDKIELQQQLMNASQQKNIVYVVDNGD